ncbi:hypothetical protein GJV06_11690 [Enterobacteriaceae bacterium RIT691]|nr:hypothetical protein [Enterobacteriaceae bacterium RIT691]
MKCQRVINTSRLLTTLLLFSGLSPAFAGMENQIEHTELLTYDMKTGEESRHAIEIHGTSREVDVLLAEVNPTLKEYSEFHFSSCLERNSETSVKGVFHLESAKIDKTDEHLKQIAFFLKLQDLGVQFTELTPEHKLLFIKQNGILITLNSPETLDQLATCRPHLAKSG